MASMVPVLIRDSSDDSKHFPIEQDEHERREHEQYLRRGSLAFALGRTREIQNTDARNARED